MAKNRDREKRSQEDLLRASLEVQGEVISLWITHAELQKLAADFGSSPQIQSTSNAMLDSFLVKARNLVAFLFAHKPRSSDIIAEDFFDDPDLWQEKRLVPDPALANGELIGQISKLLAHLTWDRADAKKAYWGAFRIAWNVGRAMQSFLELADDTKIHPQLKEDVNLGMANLKSEMDRDGIDETMMSPAQETVDFDNLEFFRPDDDPSDYEELD